MKDSFSKLNLLRNKQFYFTGKHDKKIIFKVPTLDDYIANESMMQFFSIMQISLETLEEQIKLNNKLDLLVYLVKSGFYLDDIVTTMHKLIPNVSVNTTDVIIDGYTLAPEEFEWLLGS
jgi:hypothetical protein